MIFWHLFKFCHFNRECCLSFSIITKDLSHWIGLRRNNSSSPWQWEDGTPYIYENWGMNQPTSHLCAYYRNHVRGTDKCDNWKIYICKMKASGVFFLTITLLILCVYNMLFSLQTWERIQVVHYCKLFVYE